MLMNPKVGQFVELSRSGYARLRLDSKEAHESAKRMRITSVINIGSKSEPIWDIRVDSPYINLYMTDQTMFNEIP